jgi:hypothetical protein
VACPGNGIRQVATRQTHGQILPHRNPSPWFQERERSPAVAAGLRLVENAAPQCIELKA